MKKRLAALSLTVGLVGGGAAGLALGVPALSSAQTGGGDTTTTTAPSSGSATTAPAPSDRSQWIRDALAPLVANGTLTQAQADAVAQALQNAKPAMRGDGGRHFGIEGAGLDAAAKAIGVTTAELRQALQGGQSIADVAKSKNVDPKTVVDAMVAEVKTRLDQAVTDGKLTQDQANTELTEATQRITDLVNGMVPAKGFGRHGHGPGPDFDRPGSGTTTTTTG